MTEEEIKGWLTLLKWSRENRAAVCPRTMTKLLIEILEHIKDSMENTEDAD